MLVAEGVTFRFGALILESLAVISPFITAILVFLAEILPYIKSNVSVPGSKIRA